MTSSRNLFEFDNLFSRSLKSMGGKIQEGPWPIDTDRLEVLYTHNSYGYRCEEFDNQEVLILGCSYTRGDGLPLEVTWPHMLANKMNKPYINLAKGGDGMQAQVFKAFQFFREFYNPKYIFGLFPLTRLEMPYVKDVFAVDKNPKVVDVNGKYIQNVFISNRKIEKFSKLPHSIDEILPEEAAIFYNLMFIQMLDQYCKANNIKFLWTVYNDLEYKGNNGELLNKLKLDSYFNEPSLNWSDYPIEHDQCHSDLSNDQFFYYAADSMEQPLKLSQQYLDIYRPTGGHGHWGFHKHIHLADTIYNML